MQIVLFNTTLTDILCDIGLIIIKNQSKPLLIGGFQSGFWSASSYIQHERRVLLLE